MFLCPKTPDYSHPRRPPKRRTQVNPESHDPHRSKTHSHRFPTSSSPTFFASPFSYPYSVGSYLGFSLSLTLLTHTLRLSVEVSPDLYQSLGPSPSFTLFLYQSLHVCHKLSRDLFNPSYFQPPLVTLNPFHHAHRPGVRQSR